MEELLWEMKLFHQTFHGLFLHWWKRKPPWKWDYSRDDFTACKFLTWISHICDEYNITNIKWYYNKNNLNVPTCCPIWGVEDYVTQFVKCHSITGITITSTLTICDSKQDIACGHMLSDLLFRITHSEPWQSNKNNHKLVLWLQTLLSDCLVWVQ